MREEIGDRREERRGEERGRVIREKKLRGRS